MYKLVKTFPGRQGLAHMPRTLLSPLILVMGLMDYRYSYFSPLKTGFRDVFLKKRQRTRCGWKAFE